MIVEKYFLWYHKDMKTYRPRNHPGDRQYQMHRWAVPARALESPAFRRGEYQDAKMPSVKHCKD
jgi:hypothetical protein